MKIKNKIAVSIISLIVFMFAVRCSVINKNTNNEKSSVQNIHSEDTKQSDIKTSVDRPDVKGYVTEVDGTKINISKMIQKSNGTVTASKKGSKADVDNIGTFEVNNNTSITIRKSSDMGKTSIDKVGAISDIKVDSLVEVWGEKHGDEILAKNVIIYEYN